LTTGPPHRGTHTAGEQATKNNKQHSEQRDARKERRPNTKSRCEHPAGCSPDGSRAPSHKEIGTCYAAEEFVAGTRLCRKETAATFQIARPAPLRQSIPAVKKRSLVRPTINWLTVIAATAVSIAPLRVIAATSLATRKPAAGTRSRLAPRLRSEAWQEDSILNSDSLGRCARKTSVCKRRLNAKWRLCRNDAGKLNSTVQLLPSRRNLLHESDPQRLLRAELIRSKQVAHRVSTLTYQAYPREP
jgi:hypothetical protein